MNTELKIDLILGLGRALSSEIPSSLRGAAARIEHYPDKLLLCISLFFNGEVSEEDRENLDAALTEVSSSLVTNKPLFYDYILFERRDYPQPLPNIGVYAFSRDTILPRQIKPQEMAGQSFYNRVYISAYQALLGRVPDALSSFTISEKNKEFDFVFCLDKNLEAEERLLLEQVAEVFKADFPGHAVKTFYLNKLYLPKNFQTEWSIYKRKEN